MPLCTLSLSRIIPSTNVLSLIDPPCFFSTFTSSRSTMISPSFSVATLITAWTQISARKALTAPALFPVNAVLATSCSIASSTSIEWESNNSRHRSAAILNPSHIIVGWTFCSIKSSDLLSNSPANTTAEVVPSKQWASCVFATSIIILAAGCSISISFKIVAPSFVIITSPIESTSILSIPFGPRVVRTASATAFAAAILLLWAVRPRLRVVPSFSMKIGCWPVCCIVLSPLVRVGRLSLPS